MLLWYGDIKDTARFSEKNVVNVHSTTTEVRENACRGLEERMRLFAAAILQLSHEILSSEQAIHEITLEINDRVAQNPQLHNVISFYSDAMQQGRNPEALYDNDPTHTYILNLLISQQNFAMQASECHRMLQFYENMKFCCEHLQSLWKFEVGKSQAEKDKLIEEAKIKKATVEAKLSELLIAQGLPTFK